jgi:hypothetical protein
MVMNAPEAIARRFELLIVPKLRPQYTDGNMLNPGDTSAATSTRVNVFVFKI